MIISPIYCFTGDLAKSVRHSQSSTVGYDPVAVPRGLLEVKPSLGTPWRKGDGNPKEATTWKKLSLQDSPKWSQGTWLIYMLMLFKLYYTLHVCNIIRSFLMVFWPSRKKTSFYDMRMMDWCKTPRHPDCVAALHSCPLLMGFSAQTHIAPFMKHINMLRHVRKSLKTWNIPRPSSTWHENC